MDQLRLEQLLMQSRVSGRRRGPHLAFLHARWLAVNDDVTADNYRGCAASSNVSRIPIANGKHAWPTSNDHLTCLSARAVTCASSSKHAKTTH